MCLAWLFIFTAPLYFIHYYGHRKTCVKHWSIYLFMLLWALPSRGWKSFYFSSLNLDLNLNFGYLVWVFGLHCFIFANFFYCCSAAFPMGIFIIFFNRGILFFPYTAQPKINLRPLADWISDQRKPMPDDLMLLPVIYIHQQPARKKGQRRKKETKTKQQNQTAKFGLVVIWRAVLNKWNNKIY